MTNFKQGNWQARALIKDKEHSRSFVVNLDFNAVRDQSVRVDVFSTLNQHVASLVLNNGEVRYFTTESKRFYVGAPRPDVLKPILAIPLDPRWLQNVLFDVTISANNWTCENGADHMVARCHDNNSDLSITWANRKGQSRTIDISHPKAEIQINIRSFAAKLEKNENLFDLKAPEGFSKIRLR